MTESSAIIRRIVSVVQIIGVTKEADAGRIAFDAADQLVVVLGHDRVCRQHGAGIVTEDSFHEEVEAAAVLAGDDQLDRSVGEFRTHIGPAFGAAEDMLQFVEGQFGQEFVVGADHNRERVRAHAKLYR